MPSSPAMTKVVARLSPGAHRTQSRRCLSAKLAVAEQTLQHAATHHHHHCGGLHHNTSCRVAARQTRSRRSSDEKARTPPRLQHEDLLPGAAAPKPPLPHADEPANRGTSSQDHRPCLLAAASHRCSAAAPPSWACNTWCAATSSSRECTRPKAPPHLTTLQTAAPPSPARSAARDLLLRQARAAPSPALDHGASSAAPLPRRPAQLQQRRHALHLLLDSPSTSGPPEPIGPPAKTQMRRRIREAARGRRQRQNPSRQPPTTPPRRRQPRTPRHGPSPPTRLPLRRTASAPTSRSPPRKDGTPPTTFGVEGAATAAAEAGGGSGKDGPNRGG
jgi:hypothetical protein